MRSRRRRLSPRSAWRWWGCWENCALLRPILRSWDYPNGVTSRYHNKNTLPSRWLENSLPRNTMETWSYFRYLLIVGRAPVTIRFLSSLVGLQKWYITNLCKYQLMHPSFPTWLSATETQSLPPSSSARGTTFKLDCDYHPYVFYKNIK